MINFPEIIASEINVRHQQVQAVIQLLDEGATVPFISRYRKEQTGSMDDLNVTQVRDRIIQLRDLEKRREAILKSIDEQGKLTPELALKINQAMTMTTLEDLYLPYKPKRKTKASVARERGLEPLALLLMLQKSNQVLQDATAFIDPEKEVPDEEAALAGARDIIAEMISEDATIRQKIRELFLKDGTITSRLVKGKEQEAEKFKDYFEWSEAVKTIPSHRLLAIRRGEKESFLLVDIAPDEESAIEVISRQYIQNSSEAANQVKTSIKDAYKRLIKPSIETEVRLLTKKKADEEAIRVFSENLRQLLMSAPLGQKSILALDPGFRTGCKLVCLDKQGKLIENTAIYPNEPQKDTLRAAETIKSFVQKYNIEAIVIGNGTASRETELFVKAIGLPPSVMIAMVSESGASVYSASEVARDEFPNHDVTVRGAVSIGRRIMDPLAELVKIDAKSIGVGQYQHDVDQNQLKSALDDVVVGCVNNVGVELNTASKQLLTYVSGLGPQLAENIIQFRNENGPFKSRDELKKVPRLGDKAYEQAAGFLRIANGTQPLDRSAVHPERYGLVQKMAKDINCTVSDLIKDAQLRKSINLKQYISEEVGMPTLQDIIQELEKPGRDPRPAFEMFAFQEGVNDVKDLRIGMKLPGLVTNITRFGVFVDIGVHQDGLVHISHLSDQYVSDPATVVKLQQKVQVTVLEVDIARKRISLSMKGNTERKPPESKKSKKEGEPSIEGDLQMKLAMLKGKFNN